MSQASATDALFQDRPGVALCLVGPDLKIVRTNAEWRRWTGHAGDLAWSGDILRVLSDSQELAQSLYARVLAGETIEVPRHGERLLGRETWWEGRLSPVPLGGGTGILIAARECTEQLSEHAAAAQRDTAALDLVADAVIAEDAAGRVTQWNAAAARLYGTSRAEAIGRPLAGLYRNLWASPQQEREAARALGTTGVWRGETTHLLPGGARIEVESSVRVLPGAGGAPGGTCTVIRDVGGRRLAEAARHRQLEAEVQLAKVAACLPGVVCSFRLRPDGTSCMPISTPAIEELFGLPQAVLAEDMAPCFANMSPGTALQIRTSIEASARAMSPWRDEFQYPHPVKGPRWIEGGSMPIAEPGGSILWHGYLDDVTERKLAEVQLRAASQRVDSLLQNSPLAVIEWSSVDFTISRWSDEATRIFGWTAAEAVGRRIDELDWVHPEDMPLVEQAMADMLSGRRPTNVNRNRNLRKDGRVIHCEWYNSTVTDAGGRLAAVLSLVLDVTERKHAEAALRESEDRYRALAENSPDLILRFDRALRLRFANPAVLQRVGRPLEALLGLTATEYGSGPAAAASWERAARRALETGLPQRFEHLSTWPMGTRSYDAVAVPEPGPDGTPASVMVVARDVTEQRRAEEELREADRRKGDFLAVLSHELRNPLAPIRNSVLLLDAAAPGSEAARRAREVLHRQTEHLSRLVDDLLDLTRVTRGRVELQLARVDARSVARRTGDDLRSEFERRGIALQGAEPGPPVWIEADAARLVQMIGNLLQNALKFTPPGGRVEVAVRTLGDGCVVGVRDTGAGIEPGELERIFEPFVQADWTRRRGQGGLGIGLALVRELAHRHGGAVRAASPGPGQGAEFTLTFPLAAAPAAAPGDPAAAQGAGGLSVLIIEDNEDAGATLGDLLTLHGHQVTVVTTGAAGVAAAGAGRPDVIICDVGLPDLPGHEVIRAIRAGREGARPFAIALTGYALPTDRALALAAGFDAHLAKPAPLDELMALLQREVVRREPRPG